MDQQRLLNAGHHRNDTPPAGEGEWGLHGDHTETWPSVVALDSEYPIQHPTAGLYPRGASALTNFAQQPALAQTLGQAMLVQQAYAASMARLWPQSRGVFPPTAAPSSVPETEPARQETRRSRQIRPKKHICTIGDCGKGFTTSGHLVRHQRTHTDERQFECPWPTCDKRFSRQDNMRQHYNVHTKVRPDRRTAAPRSATARSRAKLGPETAFASSAGPALGVHPTPPPSGATSPNLLFAEPTCSGMFSADPFAQTPPLVGFPSPAAGIQQPVELRASAESFLLLNAHTGHRGPFSLPGWNSSITASSGSSSAGVALRHPSKAAEYGTLFRQAAL